MPFAPPSVPPLSIPSSRWARWRRPPSLAQQLVLLAVLPAALATLGTITLLTRQYLFSVNELVRANARTVALQLSSAAQAPLAHMDRRGLLKLAQSGIQQPYVLQVQLLSDDGEILSNAETIDRRRGAGVQEVALIVNEAGAPAGKVVVEMSLEAAQAARNSVGFNVLIILVASLLGVVLAGGWAARRISAPIRALGDAVDQLGAGNKVSVPVEGTAELRQLQTGFNQAASALAESQSLLQSRIHSATAELARKNAQLEVANQAKTRLLAAASHDLRQPLHALTLFSDSLTHGETDPLRLQRIGHIRECVESLDRLFSELLNLSQLDAGVLQPQWTDFPLDRLLAEISRNFRPVAEQQELRLVVRKTDDWVRTDYVMLSRILSNLVSNSLRHTQTGGVLIGARRRGRSLRVEVWDTGNGIAPEHQSRVFEEFFQIDPQNAQGRRGSLGMGLGLATVQRLADLLNSRVELRSRLQRGTCVSVTVRLARAQQAVGDPPKPVVVSAQHRLDGVRILVIDDESTILEGLQAVLGSWGVEVLTARSRAEALALAERWEAPPDAVVTDLLLQGGDNGLSVLDALEKHPHGIGPNTARLLVTGETKPDRLREVAASGVKVLYKPVSPQALRQAITALLLAQAPAPPLVQRS